MVSKIKGINPLLSPFGKGGGNRTFAVDVIKSSS